jgi:hypothetical protein
MKSFSVLPPSKHKRGGRYEIVHDAEPAELPEGLLEFIEAKAREATAAANGGREGPIGVVTSASASFLDEMPQHIRNLDLAPNTPPREVDKPPPPVEVIRQILEHLAARNSFSERKEDEKDEAGNIVAVGWIKCGMALKAAYGKEGFDLWAITHVDERARADAPAQ